MITSNKALPKIRVVFRLTKYPGHLYSVPEYWLPRLYIHLPKYWLPLHINSIDAWITFIYFYILLIALSGLKGYKNILMTDISVKASTKTKCHSANIFDHAEDIHTTAVVSSTIQYVSQYYG